ncbi:CHAP domain-containing protein [Limnobacter sp.]|uniref:CHAP domain-containing protein n=1 Tax=Limnobacter sp. TaxID=2003368 RepID=UPI002590568D|nr:CHAP domain-containing protein [Limnobacter sp.]HEX5486731.1 CHAP domain-containing protein [Limnobacter sp.]
MWDVDKAVDYLNKHAHKKSMGRCAQFTRLAIEAGGLSLVHQASAKDYGSSLTKVGFKAIDAQSNQFQKGDVAVIQPIAHHPHGHMAMFNGKFWVSDFLQLHGFYPGISYRKLHPSYTIYRYPLSVKSVSIKPHATFAEYEAHYLTLLA